MARVGAHARRYESRNNGVGPLAWDHHWLIVPLRHADGRIGGLGVARRPVRPPPPDAARSSASCAPSPTRPSRR